MAGWWIVKRNDERQDNGRRSERKPLDNQQASEVVNQVHKTTVKSIQENTKRLRDLQDHIKDVDLHMKINLMIESERNIVGM